MKLRNGLTVLLFGVLASQSAFASRATEVVLGTGDGQGFLLNGGSLSYDDAYNMFYNPSYINEFKNWATLEKDAVGSASGGLVASLGRFNIGAFVNRVGTTADPTFRAIQLYPGLVIGGPDAYTTTPYRPIDLLFGMDLGSNMKLGLGLTYASLAGVSTTNGYGATDITLHAGLQIGKLEPFASIKVVGTDSNGNGHSYIRAGARYKWGDYIPYVGFSSAGKTPNLGLTTTELTLGGGIAGHKRMGESGRLIYSASVWVPMDSPPTPAVGGTRIVVPLEVSAEADAASWLTVRGGLKYSLIDRNMTTNATPFTTSDGLPAPGGAGTTVRLGATFHWKPIDLDWAVGGAGGIDSSTFDFANGLFTLAALTYHW